MAPCVSVYGVSGSVKSTVKYSITHVDYAATLCQRKNKQSHKTIRRRARRLGFENK